MPDELAAVVGKYRQVGILLDTNVLLLFLVGTLDRHRVATFRNTRKYAAEDYDVISLIVDQFTRIVTTPHVLAEGGNLAGQMADPDRTRLREILRALIQASDERMVSGSVGTAEEGYLRLGLTDAAIAVVANGGAVPVMTDDFGLYSHLSRTGRVAINFNHFRFLGAS